MIRTPALLTSVLFVFGLTALAQNADPTMSFFITSEGSGKGADLGGLAGADQHCQSLAKAVGSKRTWHAYLSTQASGGHAAVNARDRIGKGPWYNAKGVEVAKNVADLHSANNNLKKETSISEKGAVLNGRGDTPEPARYPDGLTTGRHGFFGVMRTRPARTGPAAARAVPRWDTTIDRVEVTTRRPGMRPILRKAAVRRIWWLRAVRAGSTASQPTEDRSYVQTSVPRWRRRGHPRCRRRASHRSEYPPAPDAARACRCESLP